jgi:transcriptional regulator with XRE-family HTH domain
MTDLGCYVLPVATTLAERFSALMDKAGIDVREAARAMGVSEGFVYKVRRGEVQDLGFQAALRFARRVGASPWDLAGEREPDRTVSLLAEAAGSVPGEQWASQYFPTRLEFDELDQDVGQIAEGFHRLVTALIPAIAELAGAQGAPSSLKQAAEVLRAIAPPGRGEGPSQR